MAVHREARINVDLDHNCFGCGGANAHGLHLTFYPDDRGGVWSPFAAEARFEGYTGMVHGGVLSTVLDEVMAWSLYRNDIWAVTGSLSIRYRAPVLVGERTRAVGWIVDQRARRIETGGEIRREADGKVVVSASATFVKVPAAQAESWRDRYFSDGGRIGGEEARV